MSAPSISAASRAPGMGVPLAGSRPRAGRLLVAVASALLVVIGLVPLLDRSGVLGPASRWRPTLYAHHLGRGAVRGPGDDPRRAGQQALFVLPAVLFTAAMAIFPMLFGLWIAFGDWNLSAFAGRRSSGFDNIGRCSTTGSIGTRCGTWCCTAAVLIEYAIAFGLALLLRTSGHGSSSGGLPPAADADGRRQLDDRQVADGVSVRAGGALRPLGRLGEPDFLYHTRIAKLGIMTIDAWTFIPFMMIMLLAGLQALRDHGGSPRRRRQRLADVLEGHLPADAAGEPDDDRAADHLQIETRRHRHQRHRRRPGGATDTVTSFIFREYRDRSNVGYGTMLAMVYLVIIIVFVTLLINLASRHMRQVT